MEFLTPTAKITAPSDSTHWGGCLVKNGFYILLETVTVEKIIASHEGKKILEKILEKISNPAKKNPRLVSSLLNDCKNNPHLKSLVVGFLDGDTLHLGSLGRGIVYMMRDNKLAPLLQGNGLVRGKIIQGDKIVFHSDRFDEIFDDNKKRLIIASASAEDMEEEIVPYLENELAVGIACLSIFVLKEKKDTNLNEILEKVSLSGLKPADSHLGEIPYRPDLIGTGTGVKKSERKNLLSFLSNSVKLIQAQAKTVFAFGRENRVNRTLVSITLILILLLFISIILNFKNTNSGKAKQHVSETLSIVSQQYEEATSLIDLNAVRARELLAGSKITVSALLSQTPKKSREYKEINDWFNKISQAEITAYKIYKLTAVPLFFDITLIKTDGTGSAISSYRQLKVILDTKNKVIYSLDTTNKQASILAGSDTVRDATSITIHGKSVYILNSEGIVKIDIPEKNARRIIEPDGKWGDIAQIYAFGGNLYLLDRNKSIVWKYIATDFGYSQIQNYFNSDTRIDLADSRELVIDGSVWISTASQLLKFSQGLAEQFSFKGFADTISNIDAISTSDADKYLYLLDKTLSRILVFDKDGVYQSQYQWDELKNATWLIASEEEKKIFVMIQNKIYAIEIK